MPSGIIVDVGFKSEKLQEYISGIKKALSSADFSESIGLEKGFKEQVKKVRSELSNLEKEIQSSIAGTTIADVQSKYNRLEKSFSSMFASMKKIAEVSPNAPVLDKMLKETEELMGGLSKVTTAMKDISNLTGGKNTKVELVSESSVENVKTLIGLLKEARNIVKDAVKGVGSIGDLDEFRSSKGLLAVKNLDSFSRYKSYKNTSDDVAKLEQTIDQTVSAYKNMREEITKNGDMSNPSFAKINADALTLISNLLRLQKTYSDVTGNVYKNMSMDSYINDFRIIEKRVSGQLKTQENSMSSSIENAISSVQGKVDSNNNLIIGLKLKNSASSELYNAVSTVINNISSKLESDPLQIRVALISDYRSRKISKYMDDISSALGNIQDNEVKQKLNNVINDLQYQVGEALHVKVELDDAADIERNVKTYVNDLQNAFKTADFTVHPSIELTEEELSKIRSFLDDVSNNTKIKVKFDTSDADGDVSELFDPTKPLGALVKLDEELTRVVLLVKELEQSYLDGHTAAKNVFMTESESVDILYGRVLLLKNRIEEVKKLLVNLPSETNTSSEKSSGESKQNTSENQNAIKIPIVPQDLSGFIGIIQKAVDEADIKIDIGENSIKGLTKLAETIRRLGKTKDGVNNMLEVLRSIEETFKTLDNTTTSIGVLKDFVTVIEGLKKNLTGKSFEKFKEPLKEMTTALDGLTQLQESPLLKQLNELASYKDVLKDLSSVLSTSGGSIKAAGKQLQTQHLQQAREYLTENKSNITDNFNNFITSQGQNVISRTLNATKEGLIQVTALVQTAADEYERLVYVTKDGIDFKLDTSDFDPAALQKRVDAYLNLQKSLENKDKNPKNMPTLVEVSQNSRTWDELIDKASKYRILVSDISKIMQIRDKDGEEWYQLFTKNGERWSIGADSDQVLYFQKELLSVVDVVDSFTKKVSGLQSLLSGGVKGKATSTKTLVDELNQIIKLFREIWQYNQVGVIDSFSYDSLKSFFETAINEDFLGISSIKNLSTKDKSPVFIEKYNKASELLKSIQNDINESFQDLGGIPESTIDSLDEYIKRIQELIDLQKNKTETYANPNTVAKLLQKINSDLTATGMPDDLAKRYNEIKEELLSFGKSFDKIPTDKMKELTIEVSKLHAEFVALNPGLSFFDDISAKAKNATRNFIAYYFSLQDFIRYGQQLFSTIHEIDTAMTELKRVVDDTEVAYANLFDKATESAVTYGRTISETITSTARWVQLGFDADTATELAGVSAMYQNVTDLDEDTAVDNLITAYKGFEKQLLSAYNGDEVAAITYISDVYDKMGKILPLKNYIG